MSSVFEMREKYKDGFEKKHGVKLGFMSAFVKAAASSLQEFPIVNAVIDGGDIVYRDYVDISVAVSSPRGLVVPVIRNAEGLNFAGIERTLGDLALKARNDQIAIEDMAGGTFTISNGGTFGSLMGTRECPDRARGARTRVLTATRSAPRVPRAARSHHQPAAERHPRHARDEDAARCRRGQGRDQARHVPRADVRPQAHRRPRGRALPLLRARQGRGREFAAPCSREAAHAP